MPCAMETITWMSEMMWAYGILFVSNSYICIYVVRNIITSRDLVTHAYCHSKSPDISLLCVFENYMIKEKFGSHPSI